jgi:uncharacterized protein (DUF779 family)
MFVRVGLVAVSMSAELAAEKVVLLTSCYVAALFHQSGGCGHTGQTGADNYYFRHLDLKLH